VPDARQIRQWLERGTSFMTGMDHYSGFQTVRPRARAVIVGGGFIGLEMAENLAHRDIDVTVIERADQVLLPLDPEYGTLAADYLRLQGIPVILEDSVASFSQADDESLIVTTRSGTTYSADIIILALGVRPDLTLAKAAGITVGELGGMRVDDQMRTSDPNIFAVGDAVEVRDVGTGQWALTALAGPANRQGRIAAEVIAGRDSRFRGTQGTAIVGLFGSAVAWTGVSEKVLRGQGDTDYEKIYVFPNSHAGYYPGAKPIAMKMLFRRSDGRVLGVQAAGVDGVDKRVSEIALAIQLGATVFDLEEAELCYSPPFGSAKDAINFAGMVAADVLRGDMPVSHWDAGAGGEFLLDVRDAPELAVEPLPGAVHIPLRELRDRLGELPRDREIHVVCRSGQRAYYATRILLQNGFTAANRSGGMLSRAILVRPGRSQDTD
jgi:NADPH-dependent 2,4-dienoyl-CoA reductase/sulfur reductase-like enzyme/rhodanese-related sulfurtransferase